MDSLASRISYTSFLVVLSICALAGNILLLVTTAQKRLKRLSCITLICTSVCLCNICYSLLVTLPRALLIHWHSPVVCKVVAFTGFYFYLVILWHILATAVLSCWKSYRHGKSARKTMWLIRSCRCPLIWAWLTPLPYVAIVICTGPRDARWKQLENLCFAQNWSSQSSVIVMFLLEGIVFLSTPVMFLLLAHRIKSFRNKIAPVDQHQRAFRTISDDSAVLMIHEKLVMKIFAVVMLMVTITGLLQECISIAYEAGKASDNVFLLANLLRWSYPLIMSVLNILASKTVRERLRLSHGLLNFGKLSHLFDHLASVWHRPMSMISSVYRKNPDIVINEINPTTKY